VVVAEELEQFDAARAVSAQTSLHAVSRTSSLPGLVPGIHVLVVATKTWMGTSPAMTG
jgi:hypothetical protein